MRDGDLDVKFFFKKNKLWEIKGDLYFKSTVYFDDLSVKEC